VFFLVNDKLGYIGRPIKVSYDEKKRIKSMDIDKVNRIMIDFSQKQHSLILAKSGGGKSYLAGVYVEELIRTMRNYCVLIIDPIGIFSTLNRPNGNINEIEYWNERIPNDILPAPIDKITTWVPAGDASKYDEGMYDKKFSLQAHDFTYSILCYAFDMELLDPQTNLYRRAQGELIKQKGTYTLGELASQISCDYKDMGFQKQTEESLLTKLGALDELGIITNEAVPLNQIVREGEAVVFDLSLSSVYSARIIVNFLAEKILYLRKKITRMISNAEASKKKIRLPSWYIPPVQFIVDEAHNYLNQKSPVLSKCIKEGRNCAMMITAISQSPDLSRDIYANVTHLFVGPLVYYSDIAKIQEMLPVDKTKKDFSSQVRKLKKGLFFYYNSDDQSEQLIQVRPRRTHHSASTEVKDERKYFTDQEIKEIVTEKIIALITKDDGLFYQDLPSLHEHIFSTICRHDEGYQADKVYPIHDVGKARLLSKVTTKFNAMPEEFLMNLTCTNLRADAVQVLNDYYYTEPICDDEEVSVLRFRWEGEED